MQNKDKIIHRIAQQNALSSTALQLRGWTNIKGNSLELDYYTGAEAGNPSGATTNVKYITYYRKGIYVIKKELTYNGDDKVLTITAI